MSFHGDFSDDFWLSTFDDLMGRYGESTGKVMGQGLDNGDLYWGI